LGSFCLGSDDVVLSFSLGSNSIVVSLSIGLNVSLSFIFIRFCLINDFQKVGNTFNGILMSF